MDKRIKIGIGTISISAIVLALLIIAPSPMARINLVMSAPTFDAETAINEIFIDNAENLQITYFTENNTTQNIDVGQVIGRFQVGVFISKDFASTSTAAHANTRVYLTLKNPATTTVWENWLENTNAYTDYGTYWKVLKRGHPSSAITLTEGTWTITTKYEVYA